MSYFHSQTDFRQSVYAVPFLTGDPHECVLGLNMKVRQLQLYHLLRSSGSSNATLRSDAHYKGGVSISKSSHPIRYIRPGTFEIFGRSLLIRVQHFKIYEHNNEVTQEENAWSYQIKSLSGL